MIGMIQESVIVSRFSSFFVCWTVPAVCLVSGDSDEIQISTCFFSARGDILKKCICTYLTIYFVLHAVVKFQRH